MSFDTDEKLKSYLDTNQMYREQMCLAVLSIDKRFSEVTPIHPRGGPDGGKDIEAIYKNEQKVFGAVGFVNQANDSNEQKKKVTKKFKDDTKNALKEDNKPDYLVFFTNINLTQGERKTLIKHAKDKGFKDCDIFDRERIRILLDGADGLAVRFQFLDIPLSEAEQATFFARWGDDIQSVISTGFQKIEKTLNRILFLQESADVMKSLFISYELDKEYDAKEVGHFRAFCHLFLKEPKHNIFAIVFGSSDKSDRMRDGDNSRYKTQKSGIKHGVGGGQWESYVDFEEEIEIEDSSDSEKYTNVGSSSSIGMDTVKFVTIKYTHYELIRYKPRLSLQDLDEAMYLHFINKSLAQKVKSIHIFSNGYKIQEIHKNDFSIDETDFDAGIPADFSETELADKWVRIRPLVASAFTFSFYEETPNRTFSAKETPNTLNN